MLDKEKCKNCTNGDGKGNCSTKEEAPFGSFVCDNNEQFEPLDEE